jgi:pimeloyl-ACP methyl ester carboxylesterase
VSADLKSQTVRSADGTSIGVRQVGVGPPLVFVHGAFNTGNQWLPVAVAMADYCTGYVVDRRGRGCSSDGADYSFDREIEDIEAVLTAAGPGAHLLGHSFGAIYALEAARRFPIGKLVLYEPPLNFQGPTAKTLVDRIRRKAERGEFDDALTIFAKEEGRMSEEQLSSFRSTPLWAQMKTIVPTFIREWDAIVQLETTVERYREVSAQTLLLWGSETADHPSFATRALENTLPNVRSARLDGQGHVANLLAPELVARIVGTFLVGD